MTNERYLIVSYFLIAALSVGLGTLVYLYLRRPFNIVSDSARGKRLPTILKKLFPIGLLFPALLGFTAVAYRGCADHKTYEAIVQDRSYLIQKNQEQTSSALLYILGAVLVWDVIVLLTLTVGQSRTDGSRSHQTKV
jgi:hypothetical protein